MSAKEGREIVAEYKRQYADYKNKGGSRSYGSWIKWKGYGSGLYDLLKPNKRNMKLMRAFANSASRSKGPLDLGKNMLESYFSGTGLDIHKAIGKLPKPKSGWTPSKYKYLGPYNPLEKQLEYNKSTGEVTKWYVQPYNKVDEIAARHDICYDMGKDKGDCDRQMVQSLNEIPYGEMPKWGQTAQFLINNKQKLGLGVSKNGKSRRVKKTGKKN